LLDQTGRTLIIRKGIFDKAQCNHGLSLKNIPLKVTLEKIFVNNLDCLWGLDSEYNVTILFLEKN
jgi:hypothetical protein